MGLPGPANPAPGATLPRLRKPWPIPVLLVAQRGAIGSGKASWLFLTTGIGGWMIGAISLGLAR